MIPVGRRTRRVHHHRVRRESRRSSTGTAAASSSPRRSAPGVVPLQHRSGDEGDHEVHPVGAVDRFRVQPDARRAVRWRSQPPTRRRWARSTCRHSRPWRRSAQREGGAQAHRHDRADRGVGEERARGRVVEEPGRRDDRRRAAQAGRVPGREEVSAARRHPRRPDRRSSRPTAFSSTSIYPIDIWTAKGALVLEPNYRGSAGYGEAFRSLNVRNLGVGDAWDVLSGIDHLIKQGIADPDRVGAMGWSQGGYISAFSRRTTARASRPSRSARGSRTG